MKHADFRWDVRQGSVATLRILSWEIDGVPFDWTGYEARGSIRPSLNSETEWVAYSTDDGRVVLDQPGVAVEVTLPASVTEDIPKDGVFDIEFFPTGADPDRSAGGRLNLIREVTP